MSTSTKQYLPTKSKKDEKQRQNLSACSNFTNSP